MVSKSRHAANQQASEDHTLTRHRSSTRPPLTSALCGAVEVVSRPRNTDHAQAVINIAHP